MTGLEALGFYNETLSLEDNIKVIRSLDSIQRQALMLSLINDLREEIEDCFRDDEITQAFLAFKSTQTLEELMDSAVERAVLLGMIELTGPES